jgi:hypothetical protein
MYQDSRGKRKSGTDGSVLQNIEVGLHSYHGVDLFPGSRGYARVTVLLVGVASRKEGTWKTEMKMAM